MNRDFESKLRSIRESGDELPGGRYDEFFRENLGLIGHPNPVIRDELAYSIFDSWILNGKLADGTLRDAVGILLSGKYLFFRIGSAEPKHAVRRTFSLLILASVLARDAGSDFLPGTVVNEVLAAGVKYVREEKTLLGYDPRYGWIDATSHAADVLKELSASRKLSDCGRSTIADTILALIAKQNEPFRHREEERLCAVFLVGKKALDPGFMREHIDAVTSTAEPEDPYLKHVLRTNVLRYVQALYFHFLKYGHEELVKLCRDRVFAAMRL